MDGWVKKLTQGALFFTAADEEKWAQALQAVGLFDLYHTASYHQLSELDTGRVALGYFYQAGGHSLFHPFLIAPVPAHLDTGSHLYDIESCYGYSGPLCTTSDRQILEQLWAPFKAWARAHGIVAEMTRYHPLLQTQQYAPSHTQLFFNRNTLYSDLTASEEKIWASYPATQRNQIRQAQRHGLTLRLGTARDIIPSFVPVYEKTMQHLAATERYFFNHSYFSYLADNFAGQAELYLVEKGPDILAAALFLKGSHIYHYHLSGSLPEFRQYRPNNLLLYEATRRAKRLGYTKMHLGGGRTTATDDPLYKFKASFNTCPVEWHIGETIHDPIAYEKISQDWLKQSGMTKRPSPLLLFYRTPPGSPK